MDESSICLTLGFIFEFDVTLLPDGKILCNQVDYVEPPSADSIINAEFLGEQRAVVVAAGFDLVASSTKTLNRCLQTVNPLVVNVTRLVARRSRRGNFAGVGVFCPQSF
jgi:hypothetical protein